MQIYSILFNRSFKCCYSFVNKNFTRYYATRKRFYKNVNLLYNDGKYEITLDHRKLKTPNGSIFQVKNEPLAIAVATEWNNQKDKILQSEMHLTALSCTAIDNPNNLQKIDMVNYLLNYVATDTVLFQSEDEKNLYELQTKNWDPIINWFNERYNTNLKKTLKISAPIVTDADKINISRYLFSHNIECLHGFTFAVDTLKSIILAFATIERYLTIEKAVHLARLEEEYQLEHWGRVEWSHDMNQQDLQARLAAGNLFIHFNRSENFIKEKSIT